MAQRASLEPEPRPCASGASGGPGTSPPPRPLPSTSRQSHGWSSRGRNWSRQRRTGWPADAGIAVTSDGHFALGPLTGCFAKTDAELIGATAREQRRRRLLAELDAQVAVIDTRLLALTTEFEAIRAAHVRGAGLLTLASSHRFDATGPFAIKVAQRIRSRQRRAPRHSPSRRRHDERGANSLGWPVEILLIT